MNIKTALVTGASGGIGLEICKILAAKGINLVISSRNIDKLNSLKKELEDKNNNITVSTIQSDLSIIGQAEELYNSCKDLNVDLLVNNAGAGLFGSVIELDHKRVEEILTLNIHSLTTLCALFAGDFKKKGYGKILNVGSMAGNQPTPYFASYAASKSYVLNYSVALRQELKKHNISVNCLQPGYVNTSFDNNSQIENDKYKKFSQQNSMSPEAVAKQAVKLMFSKKAFTIPGLSNKVSAFFTSLIPKTLQAKILYLAINYITK